jgi:hypothetical protein
MYFALLKRKKFNRKVDRYALNYKRKRRAKEKKGESGAETPGKRRQQGPRIARIFWTKKALGTRLRR